jgi:hypothetical protein
MLEVLRSLRCSSASQTEVSDGGGSGSFTCR